MLKEIHRRSGLRAFRCALIIACCGRLAAQQKADLSRVATEEIVQHIFDAERTTIAAFAKSRPMVETYVQSVELEAGNQVPIDDAYFLGRVEVRVDPGRDIHDALLFGNRERDRVVRVENGLRWPLNPSGFVEMLFVDLGDFDRDTYRLNYDGDESIGAVNCARLSVVPTDPKEAGRFIGKIWAEKAGFHVIRIKGVFSPQRMGFFSKYLNARGISHTGLFLHFDSWRQQLSPGVWVPSYMYFDEARTGGHRTGDLAASFHYRGRVFVWGYQSPEPSFGTRVDRREDSRAASSPLDRLDAAGLLAKPGDIDGSLSAIVRDLGTSNGLSGRPADCRVLLTMPLELFSVDHTVVISRGLLDIIPNESVLFVLLAHEVAHILEGHTAAPGLTDTSFLPSGGHHDFSGLGIERNPSEEAELAVEMQILLGHSQLLGAVSETDAVAETDEFLSQLERLSSQVPNLLRGHFGPGLVQGGKRTFVLPRQSMSSQRIASPAMLELKGRYGIDLHTGAIETLQNSKEPTQPVVLEDNRLLKSSPGRN